MVGTVIDDHGGHLVPMQLKGTQLDPCCEPSTSSKWPIVLFSSGWAWQVEEWWAKCSLRCFHIYTMYSTESPGSWDSRIYIWHVETSEQSFNLLGGSHLNSIIIVSVEHWYQPTNQNPLEKTEKRWEFCWVDEPGFGDHAKCTPSTCGT